MQTFSLLFCYTFMITSLGMPRTSDVGFVDEGTTDESLLDIRPFKILLEHHLRAVKASKPITSLGNKSQVSEINFKSIVKTSDNAGENICSDTELRKKASAEEISKILNGDVNFEVDEAKLQKIYDSLKGCRFVKVRSSKLWGPLWHCLNRLFLFFVFG